MKTMIIIQIIQFELFILELACFWIGGVLGYTHFVWRREDNGNLPEVRRSDCFRAVSKKR